MIKTWRLDDGRQTLVLASEAERCPGVLYWGADLPLDEDLEALIAAQAQDITGGALDAVADLSLCPEAARSFPGQPGLVLSDLGGAPLSPVFTLGAIEQDKDRLTVICEDAELGLTYQAVLALDPETKVLTLQASIEAATPVRLHWLAAPVLPAPQLSDHMVDMAGRWCGEFQEVATPWSPGMRARDNRTGRSGHEHFPGLLVPCRNATHTRGDVYAFHYGWSGGHRMIAEELPDGRRQVQFGHTLHSEQEAAQRFETAPLYATFSSSGINGCATAFQRHVRDRLVPWTRKSRPRPVHYNCWEAVYFEHELAELKDIASRAASLGAERFVLDDGWFAGRDDDRSGLGDWQVDTRKYPGGLNALISHVRSEGMQFGLWFEPEMVSPKSALYKAHPEWTLGAREQVLGRHQKVLNLAREDARAHLFERISAVLRAEDIDYIKWDHNRVLPQPDAAQTKGVYTLIDQLRAAFPEVEIESCASGGGRLDWGILARSQRVWLSDSNDALERLRIQHSATLFLPAAVTGSHVGPRDCHTSGRSLDIRFRAWVAAMRHMGFEMDPRELTATEEDTLKTVTQWWKANRDWLFEADILRLDTSDPAITAEIQVSRDRSRFVLFAAQAEASPQAAPRPALLTGLDGTARYRVSLLNRDETSHLSRADQPLKTGSVTLSGAALMSSGLRLPWAYPGRLWVLEGDRIHA